MKCRISPCEISSEICVDRTVCFVILTVKTSLFCSVYSSIVCVHCIDIVGCYGCLCFTPPILTLQRNISNDKIRNRVPERGHTPFPEDPSPVVRGRGIFPTPIPLVAFGHSIHAPMLKSWIRMSITLTTVALKFIFIFITFSVLSSY